MLLVRDVVCEDSQFTDCDDFQGNLMKLFLFLLLFLSNVICKYSISSLLRSGEELVL